MGFRLAPAMRHAGAKRRALFADERHQGHEPGPLDCVLHRTLERGAVARALAAEELALAGAHLLQALHVFIIDEGGTRASLFRAKSATILAATTELLANHRNKPREGR